MSVLNLPTGSNVTRFTRLATVEGEIKPNLFTVALPFAVPASPVDGVLYYRLDRAATFLGAFFSMSNTGGVSGGTNIMIHNATASADLLSAPLSVAFDATDPYNENESPVAAQQSLADNTLLRLDVDAVPGAVGSAAGVVILRFG